MRRPVVGVMGGASAAGEALAEAERLGFLIAQHGWILLNGGRNTGVMAASAAGAKRGGGLVVGVLPDSSAEQAASDIDIAVVTGMGDARNVINILSSDVVIACTGGAGTLSEIALAAKNGKRVILLGMEAGPALASFSRTGQVTRAADADDAVEQAAAVLAESRG